MTSVLTMKLLRAMERRNYEQAIENHHRLILLLAAMQDPNARMIWDVRDSLSPK